MISISLQPTIYDDIVSSMQNSSPWGGPKGSFYLLEKNVAPYGPKPTNFLVTTDRVGEPIKVEITQLDKVDSGVLAPKNPIFQNFVADATTFNIGLQLARGINRIAVSVSSRPNEVAYIIVRTSTIVALWESFARVLFSYSTNILNEQKRAIYSRLATRLLEPYVNFPELLPNIQSLQIMATRLVARGCIHNVASSEGATNLIQALTLSTPVYRRMDKYSFDVDPPLDPWFNAASQFGGKEAHVWIPNFGITSWLAFIKYINNQPDLYDIKSISEDEVAVVYQDELQRHRFDFDSFGTDVLSALANTQCFKSIDVLSFISSQMFINICSASYPFDTVVTPETAIGTGRFSFDSGIPFDSGISLDSDPIDPFSDGWVGLSLTGRFDGDKCLDTMVMPSTTSMEPDCCYDSFYNTLISNNLCDFPDVSLSVSASAYIVTTIAWTLMSPDSTLWDVYVDDNGVLYTVSGSSRLPDNWKVTKPDSSEASFDITNAGVLQVISPADILALSHNTMYLKSPSSFVYWVRVNDSNTIFTTRIL